MSGENKMKNSKQNKKQDGKFHSKTIKHDPQAEGARAKFGLKAGSDGGGKARAERSDGPQTESRRIRDTIESTLHNMEAAEEMIASEPDGKKARDLEAGNERRAEAIPKMIRKMKEEQAQEALDAGGPNVIGGGGNG